MIEKEIFPQLAEENELYAFCLENKFWYDIGKPEDYIKGQGAYLTYYDKKSSRTGFTGNNLIHEDVTVG